MAHVEGLRFVGARLEAADVVNQFLDDVRALCERFGLSETQVGAIEYSGRELVFDVFLPGSDKTEEHAYSADGVAFPEWWIPFSGGGHIIDHALVPAA